MALRTRLLIAALLPSAAFCCAQAPGTHELAQKIDRHYNHLSTLRATFAETYSGMGQTREEHGSLLLKKPGRMRWTYVSGKVFVLDGKFATGYTPGDPQAQRLPAKQLDDLRSPLRFLLGHTEIEKELDHLIESAATTTSVTLTGTPRYRLGPNDTENRIQSISITADPITGVITGLKLAEIDGATTEFRFSEQQENLPSPADTFRFAPPAGVIVVDGLPPA